MNKAVEWVRNEIGSSYSQSSGFINVPESALSRLVEERDSLKTKRLSCFICNDGNTPLYCLNCAREDWVKWHDFRDSIVNNLRSGMSHKAAVDATLRQFMPKLNTEKEAAGEIAKWAVLRFTKKT